MEYKDGPPPEIEFTTIEHMWLGLPLNDVIWNFDDSDVGQYRADQLLAAAERFLAKVAEQKSVGFSSFVLRNMQLDIKENLAKAIMNKVAPYISYDTSDVSFYLESYSDNQE